MERCEQNPEGVHQVAILWYEDEPAPRSQCSDCGVELPTAINSAADMRDHPEIEIRSA